MTIRVAFPDPKIEGEGFVASPVHYTAAVVNDQMAPAGKHVCDIYINSFREAGMLAEKRDSHVYGAAATIVKQAGSELAK